MGKIGGWGCWCRPKLRPGQNPPEISESIKGRLMTCELRLHHDWPLITVAVCYGSSVKEEKMVVEEEVSKIMDKPLLMGGDFNGITRLEEAA